MRDTIAMGPFAFSLEDAYERSGSPCNTIFVRLRLKESNGAKAHFDDFLNDNTTPKMVLHPALEIVDRDGRKVMGWVSRVSGREEWIAKFEPDELETWRDRRDNARDAGPRCEVEGHLSDFRVTIRNPERRSGQPSSVSIALR